MSDIESRSSRDAAAAGRLWMPGLPHALAALAAAPVFGARACAAGILLAAVASFSIYLPLAALWANGGQAIGEDEPAPELGTETRAALLGL
jgi:hypothetical protein